MGFKRGTRSYYNRIRAIVADTVQSAKLDRFASFRNQDTARLSQIYIVARKQVPYLRRFARDWATAEIVQLILKNKWDYSKKMDLREDVELEVSGSRIPR